jgi:hypothetical protein
MTAMQALELATALTEVADEVHRLGKDLRH